MLTKFGEGGLVGGRKVGALAGFEAEGYLGIAGGEQRDDGFFVAKGAGPFLLADGTVGDAIGRHDEDEGFAGADGFDDLFVPVIGGTEMAFVEPDGKRRRADEEIVGEFEGEIEGVDRGVADEEVVGHVW